MPDLDDEERKKVIKEFKSVVNMTASVLDGWLATEESRSVGMTQDGEKVGKPGGQEAVGHEMGRRIVKLLKKKGTDFDDQDYADMRKVVGYVHRHMKQRPAGDITDTRWRRSLMNWGHDPAK